MSTKTTSRIISETPEETKQKVRSNTNNLMIVEKQKEFLELKTKLLNEIEYREGVLSQLTYDSNREKGFVSNFLERFLKHKKKAPNLFWKNGETYGRYLIDADKELHKEIALAFEKSIEKLKRDYNDLVLEAE